MFTPARDNIQPRQVQPRPATLGPLFAPVVQRYADGARHSPIRTAAKSLLAAMRRADPNPALELTPREQEIRWRLDGKSDRAIGVELVITIYGVRYRLRGIFSKLGAKSCGDAVERAREPGLLSRDGWQGFPPVVGAVTEDAPGDTSGPCTLSAEPDARSRQGLGDTPR